MSTDQVTEQTQDQEVAVDPNASYVNSKISFHFKTEKIRDADGNEIGEGKKHPTVDLNVPVPTAIGLAAILNLGDEKQTSLVLEAVKDIIYQRARDLMNELRARNEDNKDFEIKPEMINSYDLSWEVIANLPPAARRGGGIAKETWDEFVKDYRAVMPGVLGKKQEQVDKAAALFQSKFQKCRTNKPVIQALLDFLAVWVTASPNKEVYLSCYEFLKEKGETLLKADEKALLEAL